jgi:ABC-type branched-subunit amino acid transport system permease subunit
MGSLPGTWVAAVMLGVIENLTSIIAGASWAPAVAFGFLLLALTVRPSGLFGRQMLASLRFFGVALVVAAAVFAAMHAVGNDYVFYAGYTVLQYVVLAVAWNILGGYVGYVNFGVVAFLALGAYTGVALGNFAPFPLPVCWRAASSLGLLASARVI